MAQTYFFDTTRPTSIIQRLQSLGSTHSLGILTFDEEREVFWKRCTSLNSHFLLCTQPNFTKQFDFLYVDIPLLERKRIWSFSEDYLPWLEKQRAILVPLHAYPYFEGLLSKPPIKFSMADRYNSTLKVIHHPFSFALLDILCRQFYWGSEENPHFYISSSEHQRNQLWAYLASRGIKFEKENFFQVHSLNILDLIEFPPGSVVILDKPPVRVEEVTRLARTRNVSKIHVVEKNRSFKLTAHFWQLLLDLCLRPIG